MAAVAERVDAGRAGAEMVEREEEGGDRVEPEMCAEPRQADRQHEACRRRAAEKSAERQGEAKTGKRERRTVDEGVGAGFLGKRDRGPAERQQRQIDQQQPDERDHVRVLAAPPSTGGRRRVKGGMAGLVARGIRGPC